MPSLTQLLNTAPPAYPNVGAFLTHFGDSVTPDPTRDELARFIDLAKHRCTIRPQQTAILQLSRLGLIGGPSRFTGLHRTRVTYQLIRRILDPSRFDQGNFGLCGPAAFTVTECRNDPVGFAQFAVHLFETGRGVLKGRQIAPAAQILAFDPNPHGIAEADFLILASVRASDAALTDQTNFARYDGTGLAWMFDWFVQAGYRRVLMVMTPPSDGNLMKLAYKFVNTFQQEQHVLRCHPNQPGTFGVQGLDPTNKLDVLRTACFYSALGWKIMLSGGSSIASTAPNFEAAAQLRNGATALEQQMGQQMQTRALADLANPREQHWMVAERLQIQGQMLQIRVWTWTRYFETNNMPLDAFLNVFGGFVAAWPVPGGHVPAIQNPF
jgi:hypothetical protein